MPLIVGEACEYSICEYVRDAAQLGTDKGLLLLGHMGSEKAGMENLAVLFCCLGCDHGSAAKGAKLTRDLDGIPLARAREHKAAERTALGGGRKQSKEVCVGACTHFSPSFLSVLRWKENLFSSCRHRRPRLER